MTGRRGRAAPAGAAAIVMAPGSFESRPARPGARDGVARPPERSSAAGWLCAAGLLALAVGVLVYLADRDPSRAMAQPAFAVLGTGPLFGAAGGWLPGFVHAFAFSLFSAAFWPGAARPAYAACALWWAIDIAFEAAQWPPWRAALAAVLPSGLDDTTLGSWVARYVQQGRFDPADLLAITAGALAAAAVLALVQLQETPHAC